MASKFPNKRRRTDAEIFADVAGRGQTDTGAQMIMNERVRQWQKLGYSDEHDDRYIHDELVLAALCYALPAGMRNPISPQEPPLWWPWDATVWKPGDRIRELVKAGALIAAEIDRLAEGE